MKQLILACILLTACTVTKSTLEQGPKYKVGDNFSVGQKFYLGKGVLRVAVALYGVCSGSSTKLQWVYYATLYKSNGAVIEDVEVCEADLK